MLVSAVTTEKLSKQKKMLDYLKTGMASERLGGHAAVSVGKEIPSDTHDKGLIEELAGRKSRKVGSA